jgi:uncharacterized protein YndB with AHSA1/START domain
VGSEHARVRELDAGDCSERAIVKHELHAAAPQETLFAHFTERDLLVRWMGIDAELDPHPGGSLRVDVAGAQRITGRYVQVSPSWRLVFTWAFHAPLLGIAPLATCIEVSFTPAAESTIVRLGHSRLPTAAARAHHAFWAHYLERLVVAAPGGDPGPDEWRQPGALERAV